MLEELQKDEMINQLFETHKSLSFVCFFLSKKKLTQRWRCHHIREYKSYGDMEVELVEGH